MNMHDSGDRTTFDSGAMRDRAPGKGRYDALQVLAIRRIALIMERADAKYGDCRNWEKGLPVSRYMDSAKRHLDEYIEGKTDEDHLGQAAWNILSAMQTEEMIKRGLLPSELLDMPSFVPREDVGEAISRLHGNPVSPMFTAYEEERRKLAAGCIEWTFSKPDGHSAKFWLFLVRPDQSAENNGWTALVQRASEALGSTDLVLCEHHHSRGLHISGIHD
jgi:hypothetical protein